MKLIMLFEGEAGFQRDLYVSEKIPSYRLNQSKMTFFFIRIAVISLKIEFKIYLGASTFDSFANIFVLIFLSGSLLFKTI